MILKGNARGGAGNLAQHLLKDENEHVEVHELRGFMADNLVSALNEAYAISRGTRCKQFLYSLSLNPPTDAQVPVADFEAAIEKIEKKLGLTDQPRAIIFHEKEGPGGVRRHAHCVWSRIDATEMKAIEMSFDHSKLMDVARELFLEHGWKMPEGLAKSENRDPKNFTLAEWQQAKRIGKDPREIKTAFQDAWAMSDSKAGFLHAMQERGYKVARGDRGRYVGVDVHGEVYSIPRQIPWLDTKAVQARLGNAADLPSLAEAKKQIADEMLPKMEDFQKQLEAENQKLRQDFARRRKDLVKRQQNDRATFKAKLETRQAQEAKARQQRFRRGIKGLWDRLRGEHKRIAIKNMREAEAAQIRDCSAWDGLVFQQLTQRKQFQLFRAQLRDRTRTLSRDLQKDVQMFRGMRLAEEPRTKRKRRRTRNRGPTPER